MNIRGTGYNKQRPIRREKRPGYSDGYANRVGAKTVRLQTCEPKDAIGFGYSFDREDGYETDRG